MSSKSASATITSTTKTLARRPSTSSSSASTAANPIRLQSVTRLKIRHPDRHEANPCVGPMTAMLTCWASSGSQSTSGGGSVMGCAHLERALKECMDRPRQGGTGKSNINYHLGRLYPSVRGPVRRKGSLG